MILASEILSDAVEHIVADGIPENILGKVFLLRGVPCNGILYVSFLWYALMMLCSSWVNGMGRTFDIKAVSVTLMSESDSIFGRLYTEVYIPVIWLPINRKLALRSHFFGRSELLSLPLFMVTVMKKRVMSYSPSKSTKLICPVR